METKSLWPEEMKVDVRTPLALLREQAGLLPRLTQNILRADVETLAADYRVTHNLVVVAPSLHGSRHTLVSASHHHDFPYPAEVQSLCRATEGDDPVEISSDNDLERFVGSTLRSARVKGLLLSLIANSNEAGQAKNQHAPNGKGS